MSRQDHQPRMDIKSLDGSNVIVDALQELRSRPKLQYRNTLTKRFLAALEQGTLVSTVSDVLEGTFAANSEPKHGTVFTPTWLAEAAVHRLTKSLPVVDLGAGTGALSFAAAKSGFEVIAIESDPVIASILSQLVQRLGFQEQIKVIEANAMEWRGLDDCQIISNPPYTRHHSIPSSEKSKLTDFASSAGIPLSGMASLYTFFVAVGLTSSWSKGGVFVIPTNWMEAAYGIPVKEYLLHYGNVTIEVIHSPTTGQIFKGRSTTACILTFKQEETATNSTVIRSFSEIGRPSHQRNVDLSNAKATDNWLVVHTGAYGEGQPEGTRLGEVFAVHRGIATGANNFFLFTRQSALEFNIPHHEIVPVVRSLYQNDRKNSACLLWTPSPTKPSPWSRSYAHQGERLGVHNRALCRQRKPWWSIHVPEPAPYLLTSTGRGQPLIVKNTESALHLNNIYGLWPRPNVPKKLIEAAVAKLMQPEGQQALLRSARHFSQGLWKLEPRDVERTLIPELGNGN